MKSVPLECVPSSKIWVIVTESSGIPCVYHIGDWFLTEDRFLFLYTESEKDDYPLAIINLAMAGSIDFSKEKPETITIDEFLKDKEDEV